MTKLLYLEEPNCFEFQADVIEMSTMEGERIVASLAQTYFYPTGGGQDHDEGWIGDARVIGVEKNADDQILHFLDRVIPLGKHPARINENRRIINMQAHTAQHILSKVFEIEMGLNTISSNINAIYASTIDLDSVSVLESELRIVETMANSIVHRNLEVKKYTISDREIPSIPFRRPPKVSGIIRVVEIDGFDFSACGGTHCDRTGSVGLIKIIKTEIQNHKLRIHFLAGKLALERTQEIHSLMNSIANILGTGLDQLESSVIKQKETIQHLRLNLDEYKKYFFMVMEDQLTEKSIKMGSLSWIIGTLIDIDSADIRTLANLIRSNMSCLIVLSSIIDSKLSVVVACSDDVDLDAKRILNLILDKYHGKGGGDAFLAQGGGKYELGNPEDLSQNIIKLLKKSKIS